MDPMFNWRAYLNDDVDSLTDHLDVENFIAKDDLYFEKTLVLTVMRNIDFPGPRRNSFEVKDAQNSAAVRKRGNKVYASQMHTAERHCKALKLYNQSIALAPNNSEELAFAYGNRSVLLFHFQKYEDCINDCDRAIDITKLDESKMRLFFRKMDCLLLLKNKAVKSVFNEVLHLFSKLKRNPEIKITFKLKLDEISKKMLDIEFYEKEVTRKNIFSEGLNLDEVNREAPCSSSALKITYDKEWGRHVTATRNIDPGEILVIEESYFSFVYPPERYLFCSHCIKPTWTLIPCSFCIFDVYCSDKCKNEAWEEYHEFECSIYFYLYERESDFENIFFHLRYLLICSHRVGGIDGLHDSFIYAEANREESILLNILVDPRTKGFLGDGVFRSEDTISCLSVSICNSDELIEDEQTYETRKEVLDCCETVYYLATKTKFFGKQHQAYPLQLLTKPNILLFAAILCRNMLFGYNKLHLKVHNINYKEIPVGVTMHAFCSLFNHSCNPNANHFITENNEMIVYAKYPITKGYQIFINFYDQHFLKSNKKLRDEFWKHNFTFSCKCTACQEGLSNICLPLIKDLLQTSPQLVLELQQSINFKVQEIQEWLQNENTDLWNEKSSINEIVKIMKLIAEKVTVNCDNYFKLEYLLKLILVKVFGKKYLPIPNSC